MSGGDWKAMFKGIEDGDLELVRYYLKIGIDVNYQHPEFLALPLSESIRYKNIEMVKLLLSFGANPSIKEMESGKTPLELAQKMKAKQIVAALHEHL